MSSADAEIITSQIGSAEEQCQLQANVRFWLEEDINGVSVIDALRTLAVQYEMSAMGQVRTSAWF